MLCYQVSFPGSFSYSSKLMIFKMGHKRAATFGWCPQSIVPGHSCCHSVIPPREHLLLTALDVEGREDAPNYFSLGRTEHVSSIRFLGYPGAAGSGVTSFEDCPHCFSIN